MFSWGVVARGPEGSRGKAVSGWKGEMGSTATQCLDGLSSLVASLAMGLRTALVYVSHVILYVALFLLHVLERLLYGLRLLPRRRPQPLPRTEFLRIRSRMKGTNDQETSPMIHADLDTNNNRRKHRRIVSRDMESSQFSSGVDEISVCDVSNRNDDIDTYSSNLEFVSMRCRQLGRTVRQTLRTRWEQNLGHHANLREYLAGLPVHSQWLVSEHYSQVTHLWKWQLNPMQPPFVSFFEKCLSIRSVEQPACLSTTRKTLILDLDETLIHAERTRPSGPIEIELMLRSETDDSMTSFFVRKRPHVNAFLRIVSNWYRVVVFTASLRRYADPLIDALDRDGVVKERYFRENCIERNGQYIKDVTIVEPDLRNVILLDNTPFSYSMQGANGLPVGAWINDPYDEQLLDLIPVLYGLHFLRDVRSVLSLRLTGGVLTQQLQTFQPS